MEMIRRQRSMIIKRKSQIKRNLTFKSSTRQTGRVGKFPGYHDWKFGWNFCWKLCWKFF